MSFRAFLAILVLALFPLGLEAVEGGCAGLLLQNRAYRFAQVDSVISRDLNEIEELFSKIRAKYPASTTEFVFVGRSPSLLAAYVQAQGSVFSSVRGWVLPVSLIGERGVGFELVKQRFMKLMELYRPPEWSKDRKLVFVDFVVEGRTFALMERILLEEGVEAEFVGFSYDPQTKQDELRSRLHSLNVRMFPISFELESELAAHKSMAPFVSQDINSYDYFQSDEPQEPGEAFTYAVTKIKEKILSP